MEEAESFTAHLTTQPHDGHSKEIGHRGVPKNWINITEVNLDVFKTVSEAKVRDDVKSLMRIIKFVPKSIKDTTQDTEISVSTKSMIALGEIGW